MDVENVLLRLKKAIAFLKGQQKIHTQQDIVKALGYNKSSVSQALNNRNNYLTEDFIRKFASTFHINQDWILFGKGTMTLQKNLHYEDSDLYPNSILYEPVNDQLSPSDHHGLLDGRKLYHTDCKVITSELLQSLKDSNYNESTLRGLKSERLTLTKNISGPWFKVEIQGDNMSNSQNNKDLKENLSDGFWVYCKIISKSCWDEEFSSYQEKHPYCFFHNTVGIVIRKIAFYNTKKKELTLRCNHPDRALFPDITVKLSDCSFIGKVAMVLVNI